MANLPLKGIRSCLSDIVQFRTHLKERLNNLKIGLFCIQHLSLFKSNMSYVYFVIAYRRQSIWSSPLQAFPRNLDFSCTVLHYVLLGQSTCWLLHDSEFFTWHSQQWSYHLTKSEIYSLSLPVSHPHVRRYLTGARTCY